MHGQRQNKTGKILLEIKDVNKIKTLRMAPKQLNNNNRNDTGAQYDPICRGKEKEGK